MGRLVIRNSDLFGGCQFVDLLTEHGQICEGANARDGHRALAGLGGKLDGIAFFLAEQDLTDGRLVGNDADFRSTVPSSEDAVFLLRSGRVFQSHDCADGDLGRVGVFKVCTASVGEISFGLATSPHEHALLLLGGFEFKVFPQVAV